MMHEVWKDLRMMYHRVEHLSSLRQEVAMIRVRVVPEKNGLASIMLALKEAEIKAKVIPVNIYQGQTTTKNLKYKCEIPTVFVHAGHMNDITPLPLPTEEEWRMDTSEDNNIGYIKRILSSPEVTHIDPK